MVKASMTVPAVSVPPHSTPTAIARKSQAILTAGNGRCRARLSNVAAESNGDCPRAAFMYRETAMRNSKRESANTADLDG